VYFFATYGNKSISFSGEKGGVWVRCGERVEIKIEGLEEFSKKFCVIYEKMH
jgi:hypothetical protein